MYTSMIQNLKRYFTATMIFVLTLTVLAVNPAVVNAAGSISSFGVSQSVFDPNTESIDIDFTLTDNGKITLEVLDDDAPIKTLAFTQSMAGGDYSYTWDGTNNDGEKVLAKEYEVQLFYYGSDFAVFSNSIVKVDYVDEGNGTADLLTNVYADPTSFAPSDNENTDIHFTLVEDANVIIKIESGSGVLVKTLLNEDKNAGSYYSNWDGRNWAQSVVSVGTYNYTITAENENGGIDIETGTVEVVDEGAPELAPNITNDSVSLSPFDPNNEDTTINFTLDITAEITVKIYDGASVINTLRTESTMSAGDHSISWDGRDASGDIVNEGSYTYNILAENTYGFDVATGQIDVDYETVIDDVVISNAYTSPSEFDPSEGEETIIHYDLNTCAYVTIKVYKKSNGDYVDTLETNNYQCAGSHQKNWDGRDSSGDIATNGEYEIKVNAETYDGLSEDTEIEIVTIDDDFVSIDDPEITNVDVDPSTFDPSDNEEVQLTYELNTCADITVRVYNNDDDLIVTLRDDSYECSGVHHVYWDGEDRYNDEVVDGVYYFKITAINDDGIDNETIFTRVDTDGENISYDDPEITDVDVEDESFDPYNDYTRLSFRLNTCADITIEVRDEDNDTVREIIDDRYLCDGVHSYVWNGKDDSHDYVREDDYKFYIYARNDEGSDSAHAYVEVNYDNHIITYEDRCAGFIDVDERDPYCDAIEYVKAAGIFDGYSDGSFRPYVAINRAETVKVVLEGFDYNSMYTNIDFWDVATYEWYYNYLRTAVYYRIVQGYPDGSFRPAQTVNRVELLKVFLESSNVYVPSCSYQPYSDVPSNEWYTKYVCFAKTYNLMDVDYFNNFNPAKPMTRGDVAELFYRFNQRAIEDYYAEAPIPDDDLEITYLGINYDEFDPDSQTLRITFRTNERADITIKVYDDDNDVVRELWDDITKNAGSYTILWDGKDDDGDEVIDGDYTIKVVADNADGYDRERIVVEVND